MNAHDLMEARRVGIVCLSRWSATERGIAVCGPVHDALLIEAPEFLIDVAVEDCQAAMREASAIVLDGFELRSDYKIVAYPDRYTDPRGRNFWETVWRLLDGPKPVPPMVQVANEPVPPMVHPTCTIHGPGTCTTHGTPVHSLSFSL